VELLRSFRKAMEALGVGGKILAADITYASPAMQLADGQLLVPSAGRVEYIPTLLEHVKKNRVGLVVPLTDLDLRSLARQRRRFGEIGCTVMVGSEAAINVCRDKAQFNALLERAGMSPIRTVPLDQFRRSPFYPCFVKPIRGSAGIGSSLIRDERELKAHVETYGELLLVQEYVHGQEFTVDVYRSRDGKVRSVVPRQRLVVRSGEVEKGLTIRDQEIIDSVLKLTPHLGDLWGVFCCQCRRHNGGPPRFFEVNPRFGGGITLSIAAGADLPLYLLQEVLALPITAVMGQFTENMLMLRYDQAVYFPVDEPQTLPGFQTPQFR
jgi:carbamoyl-phosphate synthase large subunit